MLPQRVAGHAIPIVDDPLDQRPIQPCAPLVIAVERTRPVPAVSRSRDDPIKLGEQEGHRPVRAQVVRPLDVPLEQILDFLLPPAPICRAGGTLRIETEEHGVTTRKELLDRLVRSQRDVLSLVISHHQLEAGRAVVEPEVKLGLGERSGHGLARFDLGDLVGEILCASGVCRGQSHTGHLTTRGLAVEHGQQRGLAHVAVPEGAIRFGPVSRASRVSSRVER